MQGAFWAEAVILIRAFNSNDDDRQRPCGWTKFTKAWREMKDTEAAAKDLLPAAATETPEGAASRVTPASVPESADVALSGVTPAEATGSADDAVSGVTPATAGTAPEVGSGTAVADPVEAGAFSVIFNPTELQSSKGAQEAFRDAAARMDKIAATPSKLGKWGRRRGLRGTSAGGKRDR